jgi:hypothetical protein
MPMTARCHPWLDEGPFSNGPAKRQQVDANVTTFQALDSRNILVLGRDGNLWLEPALVNRIPNPSRQQIDANVWTFQALDTKNVFVLGADGNLWLELAPFNRVPNPGRQQIDGNVKAFQAWDAQDVLVLGNDGNLWLEQTPFGSVPPGHRAQIDADVFSFQEPANSTSIFVLGTNGDLWLEQLPFGKVPPRRQHVDGNVRAFQALAVLNWVWVLGSDGNLWLEQGPFGKVPPARQPVDANVIAFQALNIQQALVLRTDIKLILDQAPFGKPPPNRQVVDVNVLPFARPGGPYLQSCRSLGSLDLLGRTLTAFCPNYFGNTIPAVLGVPYTCTGTIQNVNGFLRCVVSKTVVTNSITETTSLDQWSDAKAKYKSWTIDEPNVVQPATEYKQIRFQPGDEVTISAGGCVQTGGSGKTWKSYTNPLGGDADHLYSGTIYIPGAMPPGGNAYASRPSPSAWST